MLINDMSEKECREFLAHASFGRLACSQKNHPYVVPIYITYEPDHLYGFSTLGQKIEWMRANPHVCVEIDEIANNFRWKSVVVRGRYKELPDEPKYHTERERARKLLEKRFLWWQTAYATAQLRSESECDAAIFYRIHVEGMTGRKAIPDAEEFRLGFEEDAEAMYSMRSEISPRPH